MAYPMASLLVPGSGGDADLRSPPGLALSQMLMRFTTPVVYLWLDRLSCASGRRRRLRCLQQS